MGAHGPSPRTRGSAWRQISPIRACKLTCRRCSSVYSCTRLAPIRPSACTALKVIEWGFLPVSQWPVTTVLPGIHTSIRRSDGSVKFSQTDSGMVNLVQTSQSPGLLEIVYNQLNRVSSSKVYVRRRPLHVERLGSRWFS